MPPQTDTGRSYHLSCTGRALETVKQHSADAVLPRTVNATSESSSDGDSTSGKETSITFFAACFCPFVQRVWVALEYFGIPYRVHEVDPYKKPKELIQVSPKGLVPALRFDVIGAQSDGNEEPRALNESTVILDYIEDLAEAMGAAKSLLPPRSDPYARALTRLTLDLTNRTLVPSFYRFLQLNPHDPSTAQSAQEARSEFVQAVEGLVKLLERGERECKGKDVNPVGLWREDGELGMVDVMAGPWLFRATVVLAHYRSLSFAESSILSSNPRFDAYLSRLFAHPSFAATCSDEGLYLDSYERYAFNRPDTSQVAKAVNEGRGLP